MEEKCFFNHVDAGSNQKSDVSFIVYPAEKGIDLERAATQIDQFYLLAVETRSTASNTTSGLRCWVIGHAIRESTGHQFLTLCQHGFDDFA